jgi:hypothetical protein
LVGRRLLDITKLCRWVVARLAAHLQGVRRSSWLAGWLYTAGWLIGLLDGCQAGWMGDGSLVNGMDVLLADCIAGCMDLTDWMAGFLDGLLTGWLLG